MENIIDKIDELAKELNALLPMMPEDQSRLDKKFRLEFNYNSNHMEGNTLTYGETQMLLFFDQAIGNHTFREYDEMKAHDVALRMIKEWAEDKERPLTETNIKNLNEIILVKEYWSDAITPDGQKTKRLIKIGNYKEFPNSVRLANGEMFEYASPGDTPILMGELMEWYRSELQKKELHPLELAALLHYKFVRIHPFDDGNGRTARLLMNYVLLLNNLPLVVIETADKNNYLLALQQANIGNTGAFVKYIAQQEVDSLEMSIKAAKGESIEELDDIDKEISLFKKNQKKSSSEVVSKSDNAIYNLYQLCLRDLFVLFDEKIRNNFGDMFTSVKHQTRTNNTKGFNEGGIELLDEEVNAIQIVHALDSESKVNLPTFHNMIYEIILEGYKNDFTNTFNHQVRIEVYFAQFNYKVKYQDRILEEKLYSELINDEEKRKIVNEIMKASLAFIKSKTEKNPTTDNH